MVHVDNAIRRKRARSSVRARSRRVPPNPALGGSTGFANEFRLRCLADHGNGDIFHCSQSSVSRWTQRIVPHVATGNKLHRKLNGEHVFRMVVYRLLYPRCTLNQMRVFLFLNVSPHMLFSRSEISSAETDIGLRTKKMSITATQAMLPHNVVRRFLYWTSPPPIGVSGINRDMFIDIDEFGLILSQVNSAHGKSLVGTRCRDVGAYGRSVKWSNIVAVGPCGFKHAHYNRMVGTTGATFYLFMASLIARLTPQNPRIFLMDNLSSHYDARVANLIYTSGHSILFRPAYYPCDGPIEFIFNHIEHMLKVRGYHIKTEQDMMYNLQDIVHLITRQHIANTFIARGY
jgi:transposase